MNNTIIGLGGAALGYYLLRKRMGGMGVILGATAGYLLGTKLAGPAQPPGMTAANPAEQVPVDVGT